MSLRETRAAQVAVGLGGNRRLVGRERVVLRNATKNDLTRLIVAPIDTQHADEQRPELALGREVRVPPHTSGLVVGVHVQMRAACLLCKGPRLRQRGRDDAQLEQLAQPERVPALQSCGVHTGHQQLGGVDVREARACEQLASVEGKAGGEREVVVLLLRTNGATDTQYTADPLLRSQEQPRVHTLAYRTRGCHLQPSQASPKDAPYHYSHL